MGVSQWRTEGGNHSQLVYHVAYEKYLLIRPSAGLRGSVALLPIWSLMACRSSLLGINTLSLNYLKKSLTYVTTGTDCADAIALGET